MQIDQIIIFVHWHTHPPLERKSLVHWHGIIGHSSIKTPLTDGRRLSQRYLPPASFCLLKHHSTTAQIHPASYLFGDNFHNDTPFILMTHRIQFTTIIYIHISLQMGLICSKDKDDLAEAEEVAFHSIGDAEPPQKPSGSSHTIDLLLRIYSLGMFCTV